MERSFTGLSDQGLCRSVNQDSYHIDRDGRFFIVADGMGGHAGGQEASQAATQAIQAYLDNNWQSSLASQVLLEAAFRQANAVILQDQHDHPERSDMGTTVVAVIFRAEQVWCAHVGDSRLYRLQDQQLEQLTQDHTWVAQAVKDGKLTQEESRIHPWRHMLAQCLGREDLEHIEIQRLEVQPGDRLLLCSDGLTEELPDALIAGYLQSSQLGEKAAAALVKAANDKGGHDNITVVIVTIDKLSPQKT